MIVPNISSRTAAQQIRSRKHSGYTLAEAIITLAVYAVIASVALVSLSGVQEAVERQNFERATTEVFEMLCALEAHAAHNTFANERNRVDFVGSPYIIITTYDTSVPTGKEILKNYQGIFTYHVRLSHADSTKTEATNTRITFLPYGTRTQAGTITFSSPSGLTRKIVIPVAGHTMYITQTQK